MGPENILFCRLARALFSPEILQAVAVKGLRVGSIFCFLVQSGERPIFTSCDTDFLAGPGYVHATTGSGGQAGVGVGGRRGRRRGGSGQWWEGAGVWGGEGWKDLAGKGDVLVVVRGVFGYSSL